MSESHSVIKRNKGELPYTKRRYTDPDLNRAFVGATPLAIETLVLAARREAGLPLEGTHEAVEDWICEQLPEWCERHEAPRHMKTTYNSKDLLAFLEATKETIIKGNVVSQAEAERRANICTQCITYNVDIDGCQSCKGIGTMVFSVIGHKTVKNLGHLKACGICGCALKAKIWLTKETLDSTTRIQETAGKFPKWCWVEKPTPPSP